MGNEHSQLIDDFYDTAKSGTVRGWVASLDSETKSSIAEALRSDSGIVVKFPKTKDSSGSGIELHSRETNPRWPGENEINVWLNDPNSFWDQSTGPLQLSDGNISNSEILAQLYNRSATTESNVGVRLIQRRHIQTFWYRFIIRLSPVTRSGLRANITKVLCEHVATNFFVHTGNTLQAVTQKLYDDATVGKKYQILVDKFGSGILVVLPPDLEKHITKRGSSYNITRCESGIDEQGLTNRAAEIGADFFSATIFELLLSSTQACFAIERAASTPKHKNKRKRKRTERRARAIQEYQNCRSQVVHDAHIQPEKAASATANDSTTPENSSHIALLPARTICAPPTNGIGTRGIDMSCQSDIETGRITNGTTGVVLCAGHNVPSTIGAQTQQYPITGQGFPMSSNGDLEMNDLNREEPYFVDNLTFQAIDNARLDRDDFSWEEPYFVDNLTFQAIGNGNLESRNLHSERHLFPDSLGFQPTSSASLGGMDLSQEEAIFVDGLDFQPTGPANLGGSHTGSQVPMFDNALNLGSGHDFTPRGSSFLIAPDSIRA